MSLVDDILSSVDIVDIVGEYVDLKKTGSNYMGLCPFHSEKTPSFVVSESKQIFKCFGCGKGGNVISFVKEIENIDFYDSLKLLAQKANIDISSYKTNFSKNEKEMEQKDIILEINKSALNFFHKSLFENEKAFRYLIKDRNLTKETIIKFKLGYAPERSSLLIDYLESKGFKKEDILKAGLARKSSSASIYSFFTNRIIFPIFNSLGDVVAFSGRIFNGETNTGKYINTPETILYQKNKILYNYNNAKKTKKEFIIVVEGFMDVIALDKIGYDNVVATCGTALSLNHIKLLKRLSKNVIFSFDSDSAGLQASLRALKAALSEGIYPRIYQLKEFKDFDELVNSGKPQIDIDTSSKDAILFFIDKNLENYTNLSPSKKQDVLEEIFDILKSIGNYSIFWDYLEILAKKLNQDVNILYQQIKLNSFKKSKNKLNNDGIKKDNDYLIEALFYEDFISKFNVDIQDYISVILSILDYLPDDNILKKVFLGNLSLKEKEEILQKQLWWEEKLSAWDIDKLNKNIKNELKSYVVKLLMQIIKKPNLDNLTKLDLMETLNNLRK